MEQYSHLQLREVFHLEFLRWFGRKVKAENYAVKGGTNLRFFFKSFRYSEDLDLDIRIVPVFELKEKVMNILLSPAFRDNLRPFGITGITAPDISKAKQTETTQRFKVHLTAFQGEDLFTKIEFSRRSFQGGNVVGAVDDGILRAYKASPLLVSHYGINEAVSQKLNALASRTLVQARDIFDLYVLSPQFTLAEKRLKNVDAAILKKAGKRVFEVEFGEFRDAVVAYLSNEDRSVYNKQRSWEEIQLKVSDFIEEVSRA